MTAAAIVGVGQSAYSWESGRPEAVLALEAIRAALDDAGLSIADVDGVVRSSLETTAPIELISLSGMRPLAFTADDGTWGGFACGLLGLAQAAIATGRARVVIAFRAFNGRSMMRLGRPLPGSVEGAEQEVRARGNSPIGGEFTGPYGLVSPAQVFALWAQVYMERHGVDMDRMTRGLRAVAMYQRRCAARNPAALLREKPLTEADYAASPVIAEPLRKADICLESDGACALVIASADTARNCRQPPAYLLDTFQHVLGGYQHLFLMEEKLPPAVPRRFVAERLRRIGVTPSDFDVLGLYDAASLTVINDLETIGLCEPGAGVDWVLDPAVPYNTSGGQLAEVYLQGMNQIIEVVRQLRGTSVNQVKGAELGLVGSAALLSAAILSRESRA
jgi:acetyl-CoA acetyltransferase